MAFTLVGIAVRPHTDGDDKDNDTVLSFRAYHASGEVGSVGGIVGHFDDNTWNGPFALNITDVGRRITRAQVDELVCHVHIDPNGHDTWRFDFHIRYTFAEGAATENVWKKHDTCWLSQDNRDNDFGGGHIPLVDDPDHW